MKNDRKKKIYRFIFMVFFLSFLVVYFSELTGYYEYQNNKKTTLTKESAFNRVNVRTLFLDLERFTYNVARTFKYTVNNQYTREQFVHTLKPKYEDYMIRGGVYDYLIVCDDTNNTPETIDQQELRCAIYIKPARLVEYIMIDFIAAKTGANFEELVM
jgi:hypothetical protein